MILQKEQIIPHHGFLNAYQTYLITYVLSAVQISI